jgi:hypothetical protein
LTEVEVRREDDPEELSTYLGGADEHLRHCAGTTARSQRRTWGESWLRGFGARSRNGLDHDPAPLEPDRSALGPHKTAPGGRSCKKPFGPDALMDGPDCPNKVGERWTDRGHRPETRKSCESR